MPFLQKVKIAPHLILFGLIFALGIFARAWEFGSLPPGLNADEASIGVEAFSIYRYGVDRNGLAYPVHLIAHGSGQNALYAYVLIPFIALGGLSLFTVRLPMLIAGLLSLPLIYFIGKRLGGEKFGLIAMFLLAISPWHIMLSHWGLESNFVTFLFLSGFACLLKARRDNLWFIPACLLFGLCLYNYWTAYVFIPIFMLCSVVVLIYARRISLRTMIYGLLLLLLIAIPIGLFVLINIFHMETIHFGLITIPRLLAQPRWETVSAVTASNPLQLVIGNLVSLLKLFWTGSDGLISNSIEPYGYLYPFALVFSLLGAFLLIKNWDANNKPDRLLLLSWFAAAVVIGTLQQVNVNRVNLIFIPLILFIAALLTWQGDHFQLGLFLAVFALLVGFVFFSRDYHSSQYHRQARKTFVNGLVQAVEYSRRAGDHPICVTGEVLAPYIFVLFNEQMNPAEYLGDIRYLDAQGEFRKVISLGRYTFGLENCPPEREDTIYILSGGRPPNPDINYKVKKFLDFQVYIPK